MLELTKESKNNTEQIVVGLIRNYIDGVFSSVHGTNLEQKWANATDEVNLLIENIQKCYKESPETEK